MALVTQAFYADTYLGEPIAAADFPRLDARAEDLVLGLIKKTEAQAEALAAPVLLLVRKAVCAQIEYLNEYGIGVAVYGKEAGGGLSLSFFDGQTGMFQPNGGASVKAWYEADARQEAEERQPAPKHGRWKIRKLKQPVRLRLAETDSRKSLWLEIIRSRWRMRLQDTGL